MNVRTGILVGAVALTVLSGILRGTIDQRWGVSEMMAEAAAGLEKLPAETTNWRVTSEHELNADSAKMLRCAGDIVRTYEHQRTGETVSLIFLVGPAGPLAVHTPEVCYASLSFTAVERTQTRVIKDVNGGEHPFHYITFEENTMGRRLQRVYYAWNQGGAWVAPDSPRTFFAGVPMLYKVQIATHALGNEDEADAAERFLRENLPLWKDICR